MRPRKNIVAIKPKKTEGVDGFELPDAMKKTLPVGIVESVSDCEEASDLNVGDEVVYHPSNNAKVGGLILVHQEDILAVL